MQHNLSQGGSDFHSSVQTGSGSSVQQGNIINIGSSLSNENLEEHLHRVVNAPFNAYSRASDPICIPGTRVEVLERIREWINGDNNSPIFWISGWAGAGKSTIARTIARELYDADRWLASFFFSSTDGVDDARYFVTTITQQLADKCRPFKNIVRDVVSTDKGITHRILKDQWRELIIKPLSKVRADSVRSSAFIVIDALDECEKEDEVTQVFRLLADTRDMIRNNLRIIITSRPKRSIRDGFSKFTAREYTSLVLHDIIKSIVDHDISLYLQDNLSGVSKKDGDIEQLAQKAGGLFIWAQTACLYIIDKKPGTAKRLANILRDTSTPLTKPDQRLDEIYSFVLNDYLSTDYTDEEIEEFCAMLRNLLGTLVVLHSPLSAHSLSKLLNLTEYDVRETLQDLHSILDVPSEQTSPIRLHHPSFRDYLLDKKRCEDRKFWVDEKHANRILTLNCINLISNAFQSYRNGRDAPGLFSTVPKADQELQYACLYWVQHLKKSGDPINDNDLVHKFMQSHILHWIEFLSWTKHASECIDALIDLESNTTTGDCLDFHEFVRDARGFVQSIRPIIEQEPCQIYLSGLLFAPTESLIRNEFQQQAFYWLKNVPEIRKFRSASLQTLEGHTDLIKAVTFNVSGKILASGSVDTTVRLWNSSTGTCLQVLDYRDVLRTSTSSHESLLLQDHHDDIGIDAIAFTPDERILAAGMKYKYVLLYKTSPDMSVHILEGHTQTVTTITFTQDGKMLASGSTDDTIRVWDSMTGDCLQILKVDTDKIYVIAFSPDNELLATNSDDQAIGIWKLSRGQCMQTLFGHTHFVTMMTFGQEGKMLASGSHGREIRLWSLSTGMCVHILEVYTCFVTSITFNQDGTILASGSDDGTIRLWNTSTGQCMQTMEGHISLVNAVAFTRDSMMLASGSTDTTIRLWDPFAAGHSIQMVEKNTSSITAVSFTQDGELFASGSENGLVCIWDSSRNRCLHMLDGHVDQIDRIAFTRDSKVMASATREQVRLWDLLSGDCLQILEGHIVGYNAIAFSPDGKLLASSFRFGDEIIQIWDSSTGKCLYILEGEFGVVTAIAFSQNNKMLAFATGYEGNKIRVWALSTGQCIQTMVCGRDMIETIAFSQDNKMLASGSGLEGVQVHIWDLRTGQSIKALGASGPLEIHLFSIASDCLHTNQGTLNLALERASQQQNSPSGLSFKRQWITQDDQKLLWFPAEYREFTLVAVHENKIVFGYSSGQIIFLEFDF